MTFSSQALETLTLLDTCERCAHPKAWHHLGDNGPAQKFVDGCRARGPAGSLNQDGTRKNGDWTREIPTKTTPVCTCPNTFPDSTPASKLKRRYYP